MSGSGGGGGPRFRLKTLSREGLESAIAKAERYRLLNEPWEAESICRDVLEVEPERREAKVVLLLSLTDQFGAFGPGGLEEARETAEGLPDPYERAYYAGIVCERWGKAIVERASPGAGAVAHEWYRKAMAYFEAAERLRPSRNEDAALRWNTCARMLMRHPEIRPAEADEQEPMLE